jgi:ABC-type multidrug transport system ATPase subunit
VTRPRPVLEADGLGISFGRLTVLKSAGFSAVQGRITTLMGRNGAGKSTMMRIAVGRVRADHGRVLYKGAFHERPSLPRLAMDGLLYCAQGSALTAHFTVREHFRAYIRVHGGEEGLHHVVEEMKLESLLDRRPTALSGGERQRASLGLAMVRGAECVLMDEPFAGVAPLDRPLIARGLAGLREAGAAVVLSGHDVEELFAVSDAIIWVTAGTTHWLGTPEQAGAHHQFRREYLGPRGVPGSPRLPAS